MTYRDTLLRTETTICFILHQVNTTIRCESNSTFTTKRCDWLYHVNSINTETTSWINSKQYDSPLHIVANQHDTSN